MQRLLERLWEEKEMKLKGGLYHQTQVKLAFNSNRIEGSRLSEDQTRYIYETNTVNMEPDEAANVDDIIETVNHFSCFDYMLTHADEELTEDMIKEFLNNDILPFIIDHEHKLFYYRGLKEYKSEKGFLLDTCLSSQDQYKLMVSYFFPDLSNPVLK